MRKIIVPLTVYRPFRAAIGRSMKWRPHHVTVKWSFGKMTSGFSVWRIDKSQNGKGKFIFDSVPLLGRNLHFGFCPQAFAPITLHTAGRVYVAA